MRDVPDVSFGIAETKPATEPGAVRLWVESDDVIKPARRRKRVPRESSLGL